MNTRKNEAAWSAFIVQIEWEKKIEPAKVVQIKGIFIMEVFTKDF